MVGHAGALAGRRVLVVEDEYLLATELEELLSMQGAEVLGPAPTVARARSILAAAGNPDVALLDVNLGGELVWPLVELLMQARVPLVLATGYDAGVIPPPFRALPRCEKPTGPNEILVTLQRALSTGSPESVDAAPLAVDGSTPV